MRVSKSLVEFVCTLLLACNAVLLAQTGDCPQRTFVANVADHGVVPKGLHNDDFLITYHGKKLVPISAVYSEGPRRIIILIDVSGSMGSAVENSVKWEIARLAAENLVRALAPGSRVGLITFSTTTHRESQLSVNREPILEWLNSPKVRDAHVLKGRTALYDAVESAVDQLSPFEPGDSIYLVTDGGENTSGTRKSKVQSALWDSRVRLFTLMLPAEKYAAPPEFADREDVAALSNDSGGFVEWFDVSENVRRVDETIKQQLRVSALQSSSQISAFYSLAVGLPEDPKKKKRWEVTLSDSDKRRKSVWVGYPHEVPPCRM